ncbi:hypothetical protein V2J09_012298 [Rumex salicifolius]
MDEEEYFPETLSSSSHHLITIVRRLELVLLVASLCMFMISFILFYNSHFSAVFLPLLMSSIDHALERKYVFLVCNAIILVFLVGFRAQQQHPTGGLDDYVLLDTINETTPSSYVQGALEDHGSHEALEDQSDATSFDVVELAEDEEEELGVDKEVGSSIISCCTDEELNYKFDAFITKMKEELRLQALMDYRLIPA